MDGVFSLELSHHGSGSLGKSKSGRLEDCSDGASRVDVRKVAAYCAPATPFEYRVRPTAHCGLLAGWREAAKPCQQAAHACHAWLPTGTVLPLATDR